MVFKLGEIAVKEGLITVEMLRTALMLQKRGDKAMGIRPGEKLGRILLLMGHLDPMALVRLLYTQKGNVDFLVINSYIIEPRTVGWLTQRMAEEYGVIPLVSLGEDMLFVASNRELELTDIKTIESAVHRSIEAVVVHDGDILDSIKACYAHFKKRGMAGVRIGEILIRDGYLSPQELDDALQESKISQRMLGKILIERGKVNEEDFFRILSQQKGMQLALSRDIIPLVDTSLVRNISRTFCIHNLVAPYQAKGDVVYVVTAEPSLEPDELAKTFKAKSVDVKLTTYTDIEIILRILYGKKESPEVHEQQHLTVDELEDIAIEDELKPLQVEDIGTMEKRYQRVVSNIMLEAVNRRASDVHIENYSDKVVVRFRIDGTLYDVDNLSLNIKNVGGVVNVFKIQSGMNIAERRLPQSGRFRKKTKTNDVYDFRLQSQPTMYGENIVIRILSQSKNLPTLDEIGFSPDIALKFEKLIKNPSGLVIITGPTGSGKTTTLYSALDLLRGDLRTKIITVEDPIEYSLERIQQCQVKYEIGFGFAQAVRAFLREDPDVILIGEIRDKDTAIEAVRASQTGHLVLSTLHTNSTVESVQRFLDLGVNSGSIAAELLAVVSQRLAKKNCTNCARPYKPSKELLDAFYPGGVSQGLVFLKGVGCEKCGYRGHRGRVAVVEFWFVDMLSKRMILEGAGFEKLHDAAISSGMLSMIKDALMKVESGLITLDELLDIIPYYEISRLKDELTGKKTLH